jgi:hypothetical protein
MLGIYSTLNDTDKDRSNFMNGGFGLGSKSPFALVSSFSVTTWLDGYRRLYSCFIGEDGIPQIGCTKPYPSDEPTGLEVSFSVPRQDIQKFRERAAEIFAAFDPLPIVLNEGFQIAVPTIAASGDGWRLEEREGGPRVRMGCVFYPISIKDTYGPWNHPKCATAQVTLEAPIGSLTMTPSRESLGYDDRTCAFLREKLKEVDQHLWAQCQAKIETQTSYAQACIFLHEQVGGPDGRLWKDDTKRFTWQGRNVYHDSLTTRRFDTALFTPITYLIGRRHYDKKWKQSRTGLSPTRQYTIPINRLADLLIMVEPPGLDKVARRKSAAIEANHSRHIFLVEETPHLQAILEDLADPEWQSLADYEPPPRQTSGLPSKYKGVSMPTKSVTRHHVYAPNSLPQEGGIYVEQSLLARDLFRCFGQSHKIEAIQEFIRDGIGANILPEGTKVWVFNGRHQRVKRSDKWKPLDQVIADWLKANFDLKAYKVAAQQYRFASYDANDLHELWRSYPEKCPKRLVRFMMKISVILQSGFVASHNLEVMFERCFPGEFGKVELKPLKLEAELAELRKRWPLLEVARASEHIVHYLSLIS